MKVYNTVKIFLEKNKDRIYRYWKKDVKVFIDDNADYGIIHEAVAFPDGDFLIGFQQLYVGNPIEDEDRYISYYRLSEIHLAYRIKDINKFREDY